MLLLSPLKALNAMETDPAMKDIVIPLREGIALDEKLRVHFERCVVHAQKVSKGL